MASPFSLEEIIESLTRMGQGEITEKDGKTVVAWEYVSAGTGPASCLECRNLIMPGDRVTVAYSGITAEFRHKACTL